MKKYHNFASGWLRTKSDGAEYVSASVGKKSPVKLKAVFEDGTEVSVDSFAMFFNPNKKNENHPDVNFTFTTED